MLSAAAGQDFPDDWSKPETPDPTIGGQDGRCLTRGSAAALRSWQSPELCELNQRGRNFLLQLSKHPVAITVAATRGRDHAPPRGGHTRTFCRETRRPRRLARPSRRSAILARKQRLHNLPKWAAPP